MKIRIRHGAYQVGGNCVEVESDDSSRIAVDLGRPRTTSVALAVFDAPLPASDRVL
jgi:hypothetical protein